MSDLERAEWSDRIARLERRERRMTAIVVMLLLLTITSTLWRLLPGAGAVQANAFWLQDGDYPRAGLTLTPEGLPAFRFNNDHGEAIAYWSVRSDGTQNLHLSDAHFVNRIDLNVDPEGWPALTLTAPNQRKARLWFDGGIARLDGVEPRTP